MGRLSGGGVTDMSCWCGRDMPKPIEGVIFSQPWRAWPVKFEILCMSGRGAGMQDQACKQRARVDSVEAESEGTGG